MERYRCTLGQPDKEGGTKQECKSLIESEKFNFNKQNVLIWNDQNSPFKIQLGETMVLYRSQEHRALELHRSIEVEKRTLDARLSEILKEAPAAYDRLNFSF